MNDGTRFAIAILLLWAAMLCFFFAFHSGGVEGVSNPSDALQWVAKEFSKSVGQENGSSQPGTA